MKKITVIGHHSPLHIVIVIACLALLVCLLGRPKRAASKPKEAMESTGILQVGEQAFPDSVVNVDFSADDRRLMACGTHDGKLFAWEWQPRHSVQTLLQVPAATGSAVVAARSGDVVALQVGGRDLELWDLASGVQRWSSNAEHCYARALLFSSSRSEIVSAEQVQEARHYQGGAIKVWDSRTGDLKRVLAAFDAVCPECLAISKNGKLLCAGLSDDTVKVWKLPEALELCILRGGPSGISAGAARVLSVDISPDGKFLAAGGSDGLTIWEVGSWSEVHRSATRQATLCRLKFLPDGSGLVGLSRDPAWLWFWSISDGQIELDASRQISPSADLAVSHDGRFIAVPQNDRVFLYSTPVMQVAEMH